MHPSSSSKLYAHTLNALSGIHRAVMHTLLKSPLDLYILSHSHCVVQALVHTDVCRRGGKNNNNKDK